MRRASMVCLLLAVCASFSATDLFARAPADVPPPPPPSETLVPLPPPPPCDAPTLCEFAAAFTPAPGCYEVYLLHPGTECPVKVCFTLPCGCPKVHVTKRELVFDYGCGEKVKIRMALCGKVRVVSRNV